MTTKPITIPSMMEIETFGETPFLFLREAECGMLKSRERGPGRFDVPIVPGHGNRQGDPSVGSYTVSAGQ